MLTAGANAPSASATLAFDKTHLPAVQAYRPPAQQPNVLFIAIDDLNDWIGCLGGHPNAKTPNIDRLAARGVLFERAYCASALCNPSRTAIMTGVSPFTSGIYHNQTYYREESVSPKSRLLAAILQAAGVPHHRIGKDELRIRRSAFLE